MTQELRGLSSLKTIRGVKPKSKSRGTNSKQLELYLFENNKSLLEKELAGVVARKARIEEKIRTIIQQMSEIEGVTPKKKRKATAARTPMKSSPKATMRVMKIDY